MEQNAPYFYSHIFLIWLILPMYQDFLGPRGLHGTHMDTSKSKNSKLLIFTVRGGFFTFWAIHIWARSMKTQGLFCEHNILKRLYTQLIYLALIRFILIHSQFVPLYKFSHCGSKVIMSLFIDVKSIKVISQFWLQFKKHE